MSVIFLVRHGESKANIAGNVLCGWLDVELTDRGKEQAFALARRLSMEGIVAVYSSDLKRALWTAGKIAEACCAELRIEPGLREINYGSWEGLSQGEIEKACDEWRQMLQRRRSDAANFKAPNGEAFSEFAERVITTFERVAECHPDQRIAIVAHKMTNRVILCHALGISPNLWFTIAQDEACLNAILRVDKLGYVVSCINSLCHLDDDRK